MGVRGSVAVLAIGMALVTGCSGGSEQPAATMTPSTMPSTPMVSSSPDPSLDPLYLEAVGVYKAYFKEMQKFEAAQYPSDTLPKEMDKYIAGSMKEAVQESIDESRRASVVPRRGDSSKLVKVAPNPGASREGSLTSIRVCSDATGGRVVDSRTGEDLGPGALAYKEIYFFRDGSTLKAMLSDARSVEKCPF